jgi:hypothetical protein
MSEGAPARDNPTSRNSFSELGIEGLTTIDFVKKIQFIPTHLTEHTAAAETIQRIQHQDV